MKCPRCHNRAMSLARWVPHALYQPIWKQKRYHFDCRKCGAELKPAPGELVRAFGLSLFGAFAAIALARHFGWLNQPLWLIIAGSTAGMLMEYPLATYTLASPETHPEVPSAKAEQRGKAG